MNEDSENFYESLNENLQQFYDDSSDSTDLLDLVRYSDAFFIGEGAIKVVLCVTDNYCSRKVALAQIRKTIFNRETALDFVREVQLTASLEHANIVRIYDVGVEEDRPYFTMELMVGDRLDQWLTNQPACTLYKKLDMFRELCGAIVYAHERGILHLDIKPSNIQYSEDGRLKLMDWGISYYNSQHAEADLLNAQTLHGYIKGTPGFMAPEQAMPNYQKTEQTDIFGLGATLYYMLTGSPPFDGDHVNVVLSKTRLGGLKPHPNIPDALYAVLKKCLMPEAADRYRSASEVLNEVESYQSGFATRAESASVLTQVRLFFKRNLAFCGVVFGFVVLLGGVLFYYIEMLQRREQEANAAKLEAEKGKEKVELAMADLKEAEESRKALGEDMANFLGGHVSTRLDDFNFNDALEAAKAALASDPDSIDAQAQLGLVYFVRQDFRHAYKYLSMANHPDFADLIPIAAKYRWRKGRLGPKDTVAIFKSLPRRRVRLQTYFFIFNSKVKSKTNHAELVRVMLMSQNGLRQINFHYDQRKRHLDLSNNPRLKRLEVKAAQYTTRYNILASLDLSSLSLKNTGVDSAEAKRLLNYLKVDVSWK